MFGDDSDYVVEQYIKPTKVAVPLINDERADILGNFDDEDAKFNKKKAKKRKEIVSTSEENPFFDVEDNEMSGIGDQSDVEMNGEDTNSDDGGEDMPEKNHSLNEDQLESEPEPEDQNGSERDGEPASQSDEHKVKLKQKTKVKEKPSQSKLKNKKSKAEKMKATTSTKSEKKVELSDEQMKALIRGSSKQDRHVLYVTNLNYSTTRESLTDFFSVAGTVKSIRIPKVRRSAFAFVEMADPASFKVCV